MSVTTRIAGREDADSIDRIFRGSFCDTFAHLYRKADLDAFLGKFTRAAWQAELDDPDYAFLLAEIDGKPVGYIKLGPPVLPVDAGDAAGELRQLYVVRDQHGSGIAAELIDWLLTEARRRGLAELYLTVFTYNHRARRFYQRHGFVEVGRYDFMVGNHVDEDIIMRREL